MNCLQIFLIFFLFFITIFLNVQSLHSKSYQEISLPLNKSIHTSDTILNHLLLWPSTWNGTKNNYNRKLHDLNAIIKRKWKEQANRNKLNQERHISKLDQDSQHNQDSVQTQISGNLPCRIPKWVNQKEIGKILSIFYFNPCQPDPGRHCEFIYKNFISKGKFIQCDKSGKALVKSCPQHFKWDNELQNCSYSYITLSTSCPIPPWVNQTETGSELPRFYTNPCKPDDKRKCDFSYMTYKLKPTKFIQCDRSGHAVVKSCPPSSKWDETYNQCSFETTTMTSTETITTAGMTTAEQTHKTTTETATASTTTLPCFIPSWVDWTDNGTELPSFYKNPCTPQPNSHCEFTYKNFEMDKTKFVRCDRSGNARVKSCPTSFKWDNSAEQCSPQAVTTITTMLPCFIPSWVDWTDNGTELPSFYKNPCTPQPNSHCEFTYKNFEMDKTKFVRCDRSGNARVKSCPTSFKWDNSAEQCSPQAVTTITTMLPCFIPSWVDWTDNGTELPSFYKNPCTPQPNSHCEFTYKNFEMDKTKFVRCDRSGNARVKSCPTSFKWDNSAEQCSPQAVTTITTMLPCFIPSWVDWTDNGTELPSFYKNPCTPQPNSHCEFTYKNFEMDKTKFVRCDRSGNARVKSCPTSFKWDNSAEQCSPQAVTTITTMLPCFIPSWVDWTDNGTELPSFYKNPCTPQPNSHCEFTYKNFEMDKTKFVRCDRSGNARVKSCQQSFRWFQSVQQCLPQITTTSKPQCNIPAWVNQNEQGSPLPDYYPNPCIADSNRVCSFIYKPFILDQHKYILCDNDGHALIKTCPPNSKWDITARNCSINNIQSTKKPKCEVPAWVDEKEKGIPIKPVYPNPCPVHSFRICEFIYLIYILDQHKFIQCDKVGNAVIKSCPSSSIWDDHIKQCSVPACTIPKWMNPNEKGIPLSLSYSNPCKRTSIQTCKYFTYIKNDHKFIECDQYGKAWVKKCPSISTWDSTLKKCTTG